ncbi:MAG: hypothetical protein HY094_10850 [Candidatus Melainabacteria bacterium]|nr:hypothetical protein [Candidatus Melainabacteria bacterium]
MEIVASQTFNQSGIQVLGSKNFSSNGLVSNEYTAKLADKYFIESNDVPWSPASAAAGLEIVGAGALMRCFPGPATFVNLLSTIGDASSILISKSKNLTKKTKDGFLAWFQVVSGISGFLGIAKESIESGNGEDYKEVPFLEKLTLSGVSLLNVFSMASNAIEKTLLSMVCWNRADKTKGEYRTSLTSALGDRRAVPEWAVMATIPWLSNIRAVKKLVDVGVTYMAIREGLDTFDEQGSITFLPDKLQSQTLQKIIKAIINPLSLFMDKKPESVNGQNKYRLCWPFNKFLKFLIGAEFDVGGKGSSGFRNYCLKPIFKFLGCTPPLYYLDKDRNIVVEFQDDKKVESKIKHYEPVVENIKGSPSTPVEIEESSKVQPQPIRAVS